VVNSGIRHIAATPKILGRFGDDATAIRGVMDSILPSAWAE
jgi:hypothetical protein